jgi:hypothetical protein
MITHGAGQHFAVVYLSRDDQPAEIAEQVMRATAGVLEAAGGTVRPLFTTEADTGSDTASVVISTGELSEADATELSRAYPYDEEALASWQQKGWEVAES